ncbi:peptidase [Kaistia dalseonensis]|uniref:Iron-regulated protein n=1 Tax=Kaistia dalseonensis TaxID=410840 RepID=A0ABU0H6B5_9HYPH|nr:imelysin family protein [Kaistia dalseonensis]MCX5495249.1 peptidase [Kaistia dalseonensis]MDQ0437835.1 putative iron-regulated protein [Kaistia dalseonensis]
MNIRKFLLAASATLAIAAAAPAFAADAPTAEAVLKTYADIAEAKYADALSGAVALDKAIDALIATPNDTTLAAARAAWKASRPAYMETEGYRFGNAIVDDWEGRVNAWPLDEGLIDYVDTKSYGNSSDANPLYTANVIANKELQIGPDKVDATVINAELLHKLQEAGDVEANVATGYHAIEFLLWGQDLNGTGPGAGNRPATDYDTKNCTNGNCDRRAAFLKAASTLLISDLTEMVGDWKADGEARKQLAEKGPDGGLVTILTGLGSLSYGELAGERMKLGLLLHDPEEEHDCFSDNTANSHYYDQAGMVSIWQAKYTRADGTVIEGPSLEAYAAAKDPAAAKRVTDALANTTAKMQVLKDTSDAGEAYDQMIGPDNPKGNQIVQDAIDGLVVQTRAVEGVVTALGLKIEVEGSDSLDNPDAVGK